MHRTTSRILAATAASVLTAGVLTGTAMALSTPHAATVFYACEIRASRAISGISVSPALRCPAGASKVTWNAAGRPGVPGRPGAAGRTGAAGAAGAAGTPGATGPGVAALFGNGSDGNATINGATSISRDMYYNNLTIGTAGNLDLNGFRVFVAGTLTFTGVGIIQNNGGISAVFGGLGAPSGSVGGGQIGDWAGSDPAWTNALGGTGGIGGIAPSPALLPTASLGGAGVFDAAEGAISGRALDSSIVQGGSGGGDDCNGGGGGGGVVVVVASAVVHSGSGTAQIQAVGGSGDPGNGCGGGGGGGGVVVVVSSSAQPSGLVLNVSGGPGDNGDGVNPGATGFAEWLG
jgi:hypothetical protein